MIMGIDKMMRAGKFLCKPVSEIAIDFGIKHNPKYFNDRVAEVSSEVTRQIIGGELAKQRLLHCKHCNNRFSLRKVGDDYVCPKHSKGGN